MDLVKTTQSAEFFEEISARFMKVVINTHILSSGFQFIRIVGQGKEKDGLYLLYKDIVSDEYSFWVGYKVIDEKNNKININQPIWVDFKKAADNKIEANITPLVNYVGLESYLDVKVDYEGEESKLELIQRSIFSVSKNIAEFYTKSRFSSYVKVITQFCTFDYDFTKSESVSFEKVLKENGEICLKTRYTPIYFSVQKQKIEGVSVFLENIKLGSKGLGIWYCAPLIKNNINTAQGFLVAATSAKSLNVNTLLSNEFDVSFCAYDMQKETLNDPNFLQTTQVSEWLEKNLKLLKIRNLDIQNEINQALAKIEKQKDLFLKAVLENIYFISLEKIKSAQILDIDEDLIDLSPKQSDAIVASIEEEPEPEPEPVTVTQPQSQPVQEDKLIVYKDISFIEEFLEGFSYKKKANKVIFTAENASFEIVFNLNDVVENPNKIFNELLQLRIDPFVILKMFERNGVYFNKYDYSELKSLIEKSSDDDLEHYVGFENYFAAVRTEQNKRKKQRLMFSN